MQARAERPTEAARVLVVLEDATLQRKIIAQLNVVGHAAIAVGIDAALDETRAHRPAIVVVVVDVALGDGALMLCTALGKQTPVVLLCEAGDATARIVGLERGAADCVARSSAREIALHV